MSRMQENPGNFPLRSSLWTWARPSLKPKSSSVVFQMKARLTVFVLLFIVIDVFAGNRSPFKECERPGVAGPLQPHPPAEGLAHWSHSYSSHILCIKCYFCVSNNCREAKVPLKYILKAMMWKIKQRKLYSSPSVFVFPAACVCEGSARALLERCQHPLAVICVWLRASSVCVSLSLVSVLVSGCRRHSCVASAPRHTPDAVLVPQIFFWPFHLTLPLPY